MKKDDALTTPDPLLPELIEDIGYTLIPTKVFNQIERLLGGLDSYLNISSTTSVCSRSLGHREIRECLELLEVYSAELNAPSREAKIEALKAERDEWKNKYLMKISEPVNKVTMTENGDEV